MIMIQLLAHAGEEHATPTEAASHSLLETWYVALPLFLVFLVGVATIAYLLSKKSKAATLQVLLAVLFVSGVATYQKSAIISVVSLSGGFALALLSVVVGLSRPKRQ